jgi:orotidine-5'-phosphate decarboxylase
LDTSLDKIPRNLRKYDSPAEAIVDFNCQIVAATSQLVCAYKLNKKYYRGWDREKALRETIRYINKHAPKVPVILDSKDGDICESTAEGAKSLYEYFGADAVTVNPYLGNDSIAPFLDNQAKGVFVLCRTSNPDAREFQDLKLANGDPLYLHIAKTVAGNWTSRLERRKTDAGYSCYGLVAGATYPQQIANIRRVAGDVLLLVPGIGTQSGEIKATVAAGLDSKGAGLIINSSRSIIYASSGRDFAESAANKAREIQQQIAYAKQSAIPNI